MLAELRGWEGVVACTVTAVVVCLHDTNVHPETNAEMNVYRGRSAV